MFDQLVRINRSSTGVVPSLAESWDISRDKKTYTFHLRPGVHFNNGSPLTADDVVFSLERARNPKLSGYSFLFDAVSDIRKLDPSTVRMTLSAPYAPLLESLVVIPAAIVPKKLVQASGKNFTNNPVGTGPFMLKKFVKGRYTQLVRNPHYWKSGKPYLDEIVMPYVPDDNTRILQLKAGKAHVATAIPYAQITELNTDKTRVLLEHLFAFDGIFLNHDKPPLGDKKVRQALNYATDKVSINHAILFGHAQIANHMMPRHRYWLKGVPAYPYDIAKAKQLIAASSVPNGFTLELDVPSGDANIAAMAQVIKQSWGQIGVTVNINPLDSGTARSNWGNGNYEAGASWHVTSDITAPDEPAEIEFNYWAHGGFKSAFTFYKSRQAAALIGKARASLDERVRAKAFGDLQRLVMDDAVNVALFFSPARTGIRTNVKGFHTYATGWWALEDVSLA
jgi:peptide/nickel transport system substrate-binding protein